MSSEAVVCNALNVVHLLPPGFLYYNGEQTPDGGKVIRMYGHVVRYQEETRIRSLEPYPEHRFRPWYPRVDRGKIRVRRQGVDYLFGVPEYAEQEWSTYFGAPFVDVTGERPQIVGPKMIRVARRPIFWYRSNVALEINSVPMGPSIVEDVDIHNGFIKLTVPVSDTDRIAVDYTYRESSLIYKEVNLNPSMPHNPAVIDHVVLIYVLAQADSLGRTRVRTVYHTVGKTIVGAVAAIENVNEPVLVVGSYQIRPTAVIEDLKVTDTRTDGGGVKEEQVKAAIQENVEIQAFADIGRFDGVPFPGAVSGVVRLQRDTVDQLGSELVERLVHKHLSAGGILVLDPVETL